MHARHSKVAAALGVGGIALLGAQGAPAQDIRVYVTGSNVKRIDTETAAPIETITREDIQASGLQTISDVLRQITANNNGSIAPSFTNGYSTSGTAISLRGLGPDNTLVLLNGRRVANFGLADDTHASYVDLQQIPFEAVERIEVLKDGASAIYGADAVAGVVNVILRQQYSGVTVTGTAGTTYNGEGGQYKGALTAGTGDLTKDRYNVFVTIDGQRQDAIASKGARHYIGTNDLRFMGLPDLRPGNPTTQYGQQSTLGNVRPVPAANPNGSPVGPFQSLPGACAPAYQDGGFCRWDLKDYVDLQPRIERFNIFARGAYQFSDALQAYTELSLFDVKTDIRRQPTPTRAIWYNPASGSLNSTRNIFLPVGHPDNPYSGNNQVARLYYVDGALGGRDRNYETTTQRYLLGAKGTNAAWDWDVAVLYIRSDTDLAIRHAYSYSRLLQGLAGTGPYGYYRIGANAALNDAAIYDWISPTLAYTVVSENTIVDAKASRDVFKLEGGNAALAVGYEFRRESLDNPGWPGTATGDALGFDYVAVTGSRDASALYAELYMPVSKALEVTAAVRYDHYSDFGTTTNPKVGLKWTALPQLVLRGTYATAFRAPSLYESQLATLGSSATGTDPVRCPVSQAPADCAAQFAFLAIGNPNVQPEKSTTYTAGFILEPTPGLAATFDYWNIRTRNQITIPDTQVVLADPAAFPTSTVVRDTNNLSGIPDSGSLILVSSPWQNSQSIRTEGVDLDVTWKAKTDDWGRFAAELQWTHVFKYVQTLENGQSYDYAGTQGPYGVSSAAGIPQDRINLILGWNRGPWNITGTLRYVSDYQATYWKGYQPVPGDPNYCVPPLETPNCHVASFTTLDLSAQYTGFRNWQIFGSVINVFNRTAPIAPGAAYGLVNYNYNYAFSGATGTQFNLGVRYTFR